MLIAEPVAKRVFVNRLFTTIAPRYDRFNRLATLGLDLRWRRHAVAQGGLQDGMVIVDACTGTGDFALLCAERLNGLSVVAGVDMNAAMLRQARRRPHATERGAGVNWMQGDAQALPFRSSSVDRVLIGFSTRNLSDLAAGLREMHRVLKPGGRLVILETGRPKNPLIRLGYFVVLWTTTRVIGWLVTGTVWPFTYLANSVRRFLTPEEFVALLSHCGFASRYQPLSFGVASLYVANKP